MSRGVSWKREMPISWQQGVTDGSAITRLNGSVAEELIDDYGTIPFSNAHKNTYHTHTPYPQKALVNTI